MRWRPLGGAHLNRIEHLRRLPPHELLGVGAGASFEEIRRAYRARARAYHPDRMDPFLRAHGEEVMRLINTAYERLTEGRKR